MRNVQLFHLEGEPSEVTIHATMESLNEELKKFDFIRVHKSFLVNCAYIYRFDSKDITLTTGDLVPIGRVYRQEAMDAYMAYCGRKGSAFVGNKED